MEMLSEVIAFVILIASVLGSVALTIFILARMNIFFTFVKEGTAMFIMRGETFDHILMRWKDHVLNDPRRWWYIPTEPDWEVLDVYPASQTKAMYTNAWQWWIARRSGFGMGSAYAPLSPWRLLEYIGIYYYGLWPFKQIHEYTFEWTQRRMKEASGEPEPWHRRERTKIIYVSAFVYWIRLSAAENSENVAVDLDYLLTVRVNNPYKARFAVTDWLTRLTADANNAAKVWVGQHDYTGLIRERSGKTGRGESGLVKIQRQLNSNLPTDHTEIGAPERMGVTVLASSLQSVAIAGLNREAVEEATNAQFRAQRHADALRAQAQGEADATRIRAEGERKKIDLIFERIQHYGEAGLIIQQLEAMREAGQNGSTIIWANNPLIARSGIDQLMQNLGVTPEDLVQAFRSRSAGTPNVPQTTP